FELRVASPEAKRLIHSRGHLAVSNVEIRPRLRGGQMQLTADGRVSHRDRNQRRRRSEKQTSHRDDSFGARPGLEQNPQEDGGQKNAGVLTAEHEQPGPQSATKQRGSFEDLMRACKLPKQQTDQEDIERRFLNQAVEEDGRGIDSEHDSRENSGAPVEQAA